MCGYFPGKGPRTEARGTAALGVLHFTQQYFRANALMPEVVDCGADIAFDDVVAKDHAHPGLVGEMFRQAQSFGDAAFALLIGVVDMLQAELLAVGEQA